MSRLLALTVLLGFTAAGCSMQPAMHPMAQHVSLPCSAGMDEPPPVGMPGASQVGWINDRALTEAVQVGATRLADDGKAAEMETLLDGLKRKTVEADLGESAGVALKPEAIYAQASDATVIVAGLYKCEHCDNWHTGNASGFFISTDGLLVTNYHVVNNDDRRAMVVMTRDGRVFPVTEVLAGNEQADVAILRVAPTDAEGKAATFTALPLAEASQVGESVYAISHPDGRYWTFTEGIISRRYTAQHDTKWLTITADYARGSSGGPVVNDRGEVIGLVASTSSVYYDNDDAGRPQNLQMVWKQCVPVEAVRALIKTP